MRGALRLARVAIGLCVLTLVLVPLQIPAILLRLPVRRTLPRLWHRGAALLIGLRLTVRGRPCVTRPLLVVSNHQSWADMVALGSVLSCSFIAKSEVRGWPVFGWLARLQRTVFVERDRRGDVGRQADSISRRLLEGDAMVLFAEGTTSDGNRVLPFKTALFGAAQSGIAGSGRRSVAVQPVSIAWVRLRGMPLGATDRPLAAWTGSLSLMPHLVAFLRHGAFDVEISFGEPIAMAAAGDRKALARRAQEEVAGLLHASLRPPAAPLLAPER